MLLASLGYRRQRWQSQPVSRGSIGGAGLAVLIVSCCLWGYGQNRIRTFDQEVSRAPHRKISVLQGNIDQNKKWDPKFQKTTLKKYNTLSLQADRKSVV